MAPDGADRAVWVDLRERRCRKNLDGSGLISRAAAKCLAEGLIQEKPSLTDRRSKALSFTPKGRALYKRVIPRACELANLIEAGLTKAEARMLKALLEKLDKAVVKIEPVTAAAVEAA